MKHLRRFLAAALLASVLSFDAAAGIIQTGSPTPPPPTSNERSAEAEEPAEGEESTLDVIFIEAALDCLRATLALF